MVIKKNRLTETRKKNRIEELVANLDTVGPTMVKYFDRIPASYIKKLSYAQWNAIFQTTFELLQSKGKMSRKTVSRLQRIRKMASDEMRRKINLFPKSHRISPVDPRGNVQ